VSAPQDLLIEIKHENKPSPGMVWRECCCADIDPCDTPCLSCEGRFGDPPIAPGAKSDGFTVVSVSPMKVCDRWVWRIVRK